MNIGNGEVKCKIFFGKIKQTLEWNGEVLNGMKGRKQRNGEVLSGMEEREKKKVKYGVEWKEKK